MAIEKLILKYYVYFALNFNLSVEEWEIFFLGGFNYDIVE